MEGILKELLQYGMSGIFIAYLIFDSTRREKRANERMELENNRNDRYLEQLTKISQKLDNLTRSSERLEDKNEKVISKIDQFIQSVR